MSFLHPVMLQWQAQKYLAKAASLMREIFKENSHAGSKNLIYLRYRLLTYVFVCIKPTPSSEKITTPAVLPIGFCHHFILMAILLDYFITGMLLVVQRDEKHKWEIHSHGL